MKGITGTNMATPKSEHPYRDTPRIERVKETIIQFGYGRLEARYLARDIVKNLDNYLKIQEVMIKRHLLQNAVVPTQTTAQIRRA